MVYEIDVFYIILLTLHVQDCLWERLNEMDSTQEVEVRTQNNKILPILRDQYHDCWWWIGDARVQGISSSDMDPVFSKCMYDARGGLIN